MAFIILNSNSGGHPGETSQGYGARLRQNLEDERGRLFGQILGDTSGQVLSDEAIGARLRQFMEEERNRLVERIPGAYPQGSGNENNDPSSRFRQAVAHERANLIDHIPGGTHQGNEQAGQTQNEGIGARLRQAAGDYLHDTFPSYHLPAIPGRLFHAADGMRGGARNRTADPHMSRTHSVIDHVVPVQHEKEPPQTVSHCVRAGCAKTHLGFEVHGW